MQTTGVNDSPEELSFWIILWLTKTERKRINPAVVAYRMDEAWSAGIERGSKSKGARQTWRGTNQKAPLISEFECRLSRIWIEDLAALPQIANEG